MDFDEAGKVTLPFGKYFLWPLRRVLSEQPGYLHFLFGLLERGQVKKPELMRALTVYRDSEEVAKILEKAKAKKAANGTRKRSRRYASRRWGDYFNS